MFIEMELSELCRTTQMNAVVLREMNGELRQFPIFIGVYEAEALEMALHGKAAPRPLTHDLILNVIRELGGELRRVVLDRLEDNVFYCKLDVGMPDNSTIWVDCRPSDAMVLACRVGASIYADDTVLEEANAQPQEEEEPVDDEPVDDEPEDGE
ncbi:TPA: bifunctional nuclease family protein [Candidatus Sumerlaeota bacterium]|jgi:uncharacterized protein|nr:bifunctional nuclease family protein [Candidatus Sumerlaeota bacterium]